MKRFVFRLESVLKLRRHELETRQRALGVALERTARLERALDQASRHAAERAADLIAGARQGVLSERMRHAQFSVEQAFGAWRSDQRALEEARAVAEMARQEVTRAHSALRALEKLRERALERHRLEAQREELRELDEVAGRQQSLAARFAASWANAEREAS